MNNLGLPGKIKQGFSWDKFKLTIAPYVFIAPFLAVFVVFTLLPFLYQLLLSMQQWNGLLKPKFVGLDNFAKVLNDYRFWQATGRNLIILLLTLIPANLIAFMLALILNSSLIKGKAFFKTMFLLPFLLPVVVNGLLFAILYGQNYGIFNWVLSTDIMKALIPVKLPVLWTSGWMSLVSISIMDNWRWIGLYTILYLAGLEIEKKIFVKQTRISVFKTIAWFFRDKHPALKPILMINLAIGLFNNSTMFDAPAILLGKSGAMVGGMDYSGVTPFVYWYNAAFGQGYYGRSAVTCFLIIIMLGMSYLIYQKIFKKDIQKIKNWSVPEREESQTFESENNNHDFSDELRVRDRSARLKTICRVLLYIPLVIWVFVSIFPILYIFIMATKSTSQIYSFPPPLYILQDAWENLQMNYQHLLNEIPFWRNMWNSFLISIGASLASLFFCTLAGYGFGMYKFKGSKTLFPWMILSLMISNIFLFIPYFALMVSLGWINNPLAIIVPGAANVCGVFVMKQLIVASIPRSVVEAARMEGVSEIGIFLKIIFPGIKNFFVLFGTIIFILNWNNFFAPLILMTDRETMPITVALNTLRGFASVDWGAVMLGSALSILPIIILYLIFSPWIFNNISLWAAVVAQSTQADEQLMIPSKQEKMNKKQEVIHRAKINPVKSDVNEVREENPETPSHSEAGGTFTNNNFASISEEEKIKNAADLARKMSGIAKRMK